MCRILIVEDEKPLADHVRLVVENRCRYSLEVTDVSTLSAAKEYFSSFGFPAVVVLDLGIPDGDGMTLLSYNGLVDNSAIIIYSARDLTSVDRAILMKQGASFVLQKSVSAEELTECVNKGVLISDWLQRKRKYRMSPSGRADLMSAEKKLAESPFARSLEANQAV